MINNITKIAGELMAINTVKRTPVRAFQFPLHVNGTPETNLNESALVSYGFRVPGGGWMSANVFKSENFSRENPLMLVQGVDVCGTKFEKEININDINPQNASFIELLAFDGYSAANGKPSMTSRIASRAVIMQELNGKEFSAFNAFTQMDFVSTLRGLIESLCANKNYETLVWVNSNVEPFLGGKHND